MVGSVGGLVWKKLKASGRSGVKKSAVKLLAAVASDLRGFLSGVEGGMSRQGPALQN